MCAATHSDRHRERARQIYEERRPSPAEQELPAEKLIEELRIHQIELELQNQELQHSREEAERARREAETARDRYRTLFHRAPAGHLLIDADGWIEQANGHAGELLGTDPARPPPANLFDLLHAGEASHVERAVGRALGAEGTTPAPVTVAVSSGAGHTRFLEFSAVAVSTENGEPRLLVSLLDVTERQLQTEQHRQNADYYRRLLREVNHRVKNNLQVLSSVVELERAGAEDDQHLARIAERIRNVSRVHTALHDAAVDVDEVDAVTTLTTFVDGLRSYLPAHIGLGFTSDFAELRLPSRRVLALGLLVNELVTNAVRHAFPDGRRGSVQVSLSRAADRARLVITDDGVGMRTTTNTAAAESGVGVGTELARQLAGDLDASWETSSGPGVRHDITFPLE